MIVPKVIDITGPIIGDTNIAATMFVALFSIKPSPAKELEKNSRINSAYAIKFQIHATHQAVKINRIKSNEHWPPLRTPSTTCFTVSLDLIDSTKLFHFETASLLSALI